MSLINDALKKAQQQRADETAAQTPPAPPARPAPDTISAPHPDDLRPKIPAPPPPANRPQLPIPPPRTIAPPRPASATRPANLPPIVNYSIPQLEPDEQPATPISRPRVSSSIRYNAGEDEETGRNAPRSSLQKTFWISLGVIAAIAIVVRLAVTLGRDDETATRPHTEQAAPAQVAVALPTPTLPPPAPPIILPTREKAPVVTEPAPVVAVTAPATEPPPPTITFPAAPTPTAKPAPTPAPVASKPAAPAPVVTLPPPPPAPPPAAEPKPATSVLPPLYAPRAPAPVNNTTRIQNFIDRLRVTGVRITDKGSKVILNDRLFNVGETVDSGLELKLVKIEQGMITFSDPGGKKYVKLYQ